jgi:folate-binding protein YgfZ
MSSNNKVVAARRVPDDEYNAVRVKGAGLIDLSDRGRIKVSGSEAIMFLNGLITNDMKTLERNHWMLAAFPNVQGRLIAAVRVMRLADENSGPTFLLDTEASTSETVLKTIGRFTLAGDFHVSDLTRDTSQLSIQGKDAAAILTAVTQSAPASLPQNGLQQISWNEHPVVVIRTSHTAEDGFDLIVPSDAIDSLQETLVQAGARLVSQATFQTLRIEAGSPLFGKDMDESNVVSETNLDEAISFTKGCYIGQEIIARIKYRGHVAKKLTGLLFDDDIQVEVSSAIKSGGKEIGRITSVTYSPSLGRTVALGYVRFEHLEPGTKVMVTTGNSEIEATVNELPFVRGSWYSESVMTNG